MEGQYPNWWEKKGSATTSNTQKLKPTVIRMVLSSIDKSEFKISKHGFVGFRLPRKYNPH